MKVMTFTVQYASRFFLHDYATNFVSSKWNTLLRRPIPNKKPSLLLLCGDIGFRQALQTHKFIEYCSSNWERVVWIEGMKEKECNPDGSPPRPLPRNVKYVRNLEHIALNSSLYLYAAEQFTEKDIQSVLDP